MAGLYQSPDRIRPRRTSPIPPPPGIDSYDLETAGMPPPRQGVMADPAAPAAPIVPQAPVGAGAIERSIADPNDLGRSTANPTLAANLPQVANIPPPTEAGVQPPFYRQSMQRSQSTAGLNPVGQKLAQIDALKKAKANQKVFVGDDGNIETEYPHKLGRGKEALMGILYGALEGAKVGGWKGAVGGAATGGVAGAVNPDLIGAFERQNEIGEVQRSLDQDVANQAKQQTIGLQGSQIQENLAQAERARMGTPHYIQQDDGSWVAAYDNQALPVTDQAGNTVVGKDPNAGLEESKRYHDQLIAARKAESTRRAAREKEQAGRLQLSIDQTTGDHILFNPTTGREFIGRRGTKQAVKLAQAQAIWESAGKQYNTDAKPKFDEADRLRDEADELGNDPDTGKPSPALAFRNKAKIDANRKQADRLEREAEGIATKVRTNQSKGDELAAEAQAAEATGKAGSSKPSQSRPKLTEQQVRDAATKANLDPDEAVRRARLKGRL